MTALASRFTQSISPAGNYRQTKARKVGANVDLWEGTLVMLDAGVAKPYTAAGYAAGATLAGFPECTISNATGSVVTQADPNTFFRGCEMTISGKAGDLSTEANVGGPVYLKDNFTVGKTNSGTDQAVTLLESTETRNDGYYLILLP